MATFSAEWSYGTFSLPAHPSGARQAQEGLSIVLVDNLFRGHADSSRNCSCGTVEIFSVGWSYGTFRLPAGVEEVSRIRSPLIAHRAKRAK
jgi:hypothetical protein